MRETRGFDRPKYEWFLPQGPKLPYAVSFTICGKCNISPKLMPLLPTYITIGVSSNGGEIVLAEGDDSGYKPPKSGYLKDPNLIRAIVERGIELPARYRMEQMEEGVWLGTLLNPPQKTELPIKPMPKRPRKSGLSAMMPEK